MIVTNNANNTLISGTDAADTITNTGDNVTIENSGGRDVINLDGSNQTFAFMNGSSSNTVIGFDEDDTVYVPQIDWTSTDSRNGPRWSVYNNNVFIRNINGVYSDEVILINGTNKKINFASADTRLKMLFNGTANQTVRSEADIDYIFNFAQNTMILGDASDNHILNRSNADSVTADGGAGNDTIINEASRVVAINGGNGNDVIIDNYGSSWLGQYHTINGGAGNDSISLQSGSVDKEYVLEYAAGDGHDTVIGFSEIDTLRLVDGTVNNISINNFNARIDVGDGSVLLKNMVGRPFTFIDPDGNANETIIGWALQGKDKGELFDSDVDDILIKPGGGNDTIDVSHARLVVDFDSGKDVILGMDSDDTIRLNFVSGYWRASLDGSDVLMIRHRYDHKDDDLITIKDAVDKKITIITIDGEEIYCPPAGLTLGNDNDIRRITNYYSDVLIDINGNDKYVWSYIADNVSIKAEGNNEISAGGKNLSIKSGAGNDTIYAGGEVVVLENVRIESDGGDNIVEVDGDFDFEENLGRLGKDVNVKLGAGRDSIKVYNVVETKIEAGAGDDSIEVFSVSDITINGGAGNDLITLDGARQILTYGTGDGNDTVTGFGADDTLRIDGEYSTVASGNDVIVNVGAQKIIVKDAADISLNIVDNASSDSGTDSLTSGIEYNPKKPSTITVKDPFGGTVEAKNFSDKVTLIDASKASKPVMLKGGDKAGVLRAGDGGSTLIGGKNADKLYGGDGVDYFVYEVSQGTDALYDVSTSDVVSIDGAALDDITFKDAKGSVALTFSTNKKAKLTVNKIDADKELKFNIGGEEFIYGSLPSGASFNKNKTTVTIDDRTTVDDGATIDLSLVSTVIKEINASKSEVALNLIGNANANVLRAGAGGSTLYGGHSTRAVADKLYGGDGADVFLYREGDGNDVVYGLDGGRGDYVVLDGVTTLEAKDVKESVNKVEVKIGKQKLTIDNPKGEVKFVAGDGNLLYKTGVNLPDGVEYIKNKTAVTIAEGADVDVIDAGELFSTVKIVDATKFDKPIELLGNAQKNEIRAGSLGSTMNGGKGDDKLYGGAGVDHFVYTVGEGADAFFSVEAQDVIDLNGATVDQMQFKENKNAVTVTFTNDKKSKVTINRLNADAPVLFVTSEGEFAYGSMPGGVTYDQKKTALYIADPFEGTIDVTDYAASVVTLDGSSATNAIELIGNKKTKALIGGAGETTLRGSTINDKFFGGTGNDWFVYNAGDGKDQIYNFDSSTDVISIGGATVGVTDFVEKGNDIVLTVGKGSITLKDAPRGTIRVMHDGGVVNYKTMPEGVTYDPKKGLIRLDKSFKGELITAKLGVPVNEINASATANKILIVATDKAKMISGSGESTLFAAEGDFTLTGGKGRDVFLMDQTNALIDKYTPGEDFIRVMGTVESGSVVGSNVELTAINFGVETTITIKGALNKELRANGTTYKFTKKATTLETAAISSQLPSAVEDYWFNDLEIPSDELDSILDAKNIAVGLDDNPVPKNIFQSHDMIAPARRHKKL